MRNPVLLCLGLSLPLPAQATPCYDFGPIDDVMVEMTATLTPNASLAIARDAVPLFSAHYGTFGPSTVVPIASATKWLSGAVIMSLVDDGLLDLDAPVSTYLPNFTGLAGTMTVRQMFSHTAGTVGDHWAISAANLTLEQAVNVLAQVPLRAPPGTDFYYGGVSMHIAGRVAEVVAGQDWATLFQTRIAGPLQMTATDYLGIGSASNPRIAGGVRSTLADLANFVAMLQQGGNFQGTQVLSPNAVDALFEDQTGGVPITSAPVAAPGLGYAIGAWVERRDAGGRVVEASSQGAFGCTPWVDRERGTSGVFLTADLVVQTDPYSDRVRFACYDALRFRGVECYGGASPTCAGFVRATTNAIPVAGSAAFSAIAHDARPNALGAVVIALAPALPPIQIAGVDIHVDLASSISAVLAADGAGRVVYPAPLTWVPPGTGIFLQFAFLQRPFCQGPDAFVTTHGLAITAQ
ncbi:MAG: beta-lactamase family protein [Planctomycetes bacterium]|nr:beta-lactamase family protein [Planctomycetota bacterium]